ncbi:uncharacterized protein LOC127286077 [Leptopilina boulardi]|uniref:uncharacterized protein LOC127286077 n=1 Tax=Leptopilina boulardi TaxID=63433 RepID=UPI0021F61DEB|nr:uncharacterized protein LOC127286077 [Leptopilina boulardi]XP_051168326.1 uncharacterized protein LOC127286077 [Leptopilina boulardi]
MMSSPTTCSSDLEFVSLTRREDIVWPEVALNSSDSEVSDASTLPLNDITLAQSDIPDTPACPDPVFEAYFDAHARPYSPAPHSTGVGSVESCSKRDSSAQTNSYFPEGFPLEGNFYNIPAHSSATHLLNSDLPLRPYVPPAADEQVVLQLIARRRLLADGSIRMEYRWAGPNFY